MLLIKELNLRQIKRLYFYLQDFVLENSSVKLKLIGNKLFIDKVDYLSLDSKIRRKIRIAAKHYILFYDKQDPIYTVVGVDEKSGKIHDEIITFFYSMTEAEYFILNSTLSFKYYVIEKVHPGLAPVEKAWFADGKKIDKPMLIKHIVRWSFNGAF